MIIHKNHYDDMTAETNNAATLHLEGVVWA